LTCTFFFFFSSTDERIREIDTASSGFLYAVSSHSITGGSSANNLSEYGSRLAALNLKNPIKVGFGIHDAKSFQEAIAIANGGIIGSAFIKAISEEGELDNNICSFVASIRSKD
jgi:tryptophan synthase alpha chain